MSAGFVPVEARQTRARSASPLHAGHIVRLRRRFETVQLKGSVAEVVFLNSHDETSAYRLRMGIFRVVCTNGLMGSHGSFPAYCVSHRGSVMDAVVAGALKLAEEFEHLAAEVERMEHRFPDPAQAGMEPSQLLTCRRVEDTVDDLWRVLDRCRRHSCAAA